ncbi:DUF3313 domain-containing protein [Sphingomonas sp. G124]|uniref:DUF3313 domain-containing protein n=1 Tax=Sphingomonas cremea TaxID=2904799 RepID=A0A9X1TXI8_9SPHN|nr:DUF3313 family protein [Sphingomonas cremea]MCF2515230.1 DUF3313 domain-containing protein [Sphingomonas cremea]
MHGIKLMLAVLALTATAPASAAKLPPSWDGLVQVKAKKLAAVYLLPNADFRAYSKVMLDPAQVAFEKNWARDYNSSTMTLGGRVTDSEVQKAIADAQAGLNKIFAETFAKQGYVVATAPGPDVARVTFGVIDLAVTAPDVGIGMGDTFAVDAGEATFVIEVRDSITNQLLGRGLDRRAAGDNGPGYLRTSVSNRDDFEQLFETWANIAAKGLIELRASSPVNTDGIRKQ